VTRNGDRGSPAGPPFYEAPSDLVRVTDITAARDSGIGNTKRFIHRPCLEAVVSSAATACFSIALVSRLR
jgi:hypothetical protein